MGSQVSSLWQRMRLLLILPFLAVAIAQKKSYDGHQVLRVGPIDDESYFVLRDLQMTSNALDFWTEPAPGKTTDINIPPEGLASVKAWLEEKGISYSIMIEDLGPLSESNQPESANIRDFVLTLDPLPVLGHTFHSYSQLWLWPYGYDYGAYPENYKEVQQLAIDASDALFQVHGTVFDPINSADLYPAAGASDDWYKSIGCRYAFTTELRDTGHYGFELPKEQIIPSGEEMWAGFEVVIDRVQQAIAEEKAKKNL